MHITDQGFSGKSWRARSKAGVDGASAGLQPGPGSAQYDELPALYLLVQGRLNPLHRKPTPTGASTIHLDTMSICLKPYV